jgi:hypothetical protein
MANPSTGIPAASGYPQYSGYLTAPIFGQDLIERFYCSTVFGEITTTEYLGELTKCGDQISFWREPTVQVRDHIKDGTIKHDTLEANQVTLTIDKAKEFSVKIAKVDEKQMCNWDMWRESMLKAASRASADAIDLELINSIYVDAGAFNRGANAGAASGGYNLGTIGAPRQIDASNILEVLIDLGSVLNEQCVPRENRWMIVPPQFENLLHKANLVTVPFNGFCSMNGKICDNIAGFQIYSSNGLTSVTDPSTNEESYNIVAGWKGSVVFASQLEETRVIEDKDSWDRYYQGLMVYGFGTIQPNGLAHLYATL